MRVLALDYGSARCGCAVSDPTGVLATPLEPVTRTGARGAGSGGCGRSLPNWAPSGWSSGCRCRCPGATRRRRPRRGRSPRGLQTTLAVPVELYDERFTTRLAERYRGPRRRGLACRGALLESWLAAPAPAGVARG